jgi:RNA polymerase sigma factor (sigma-70 family)
MAEYLSVADLVTRAKNGEQQAWDALVERYAPLIWSICRHFRLETADAEDVCQAVWLKLVTHLDHLREAAALPGWLATTTRRECGRVINAADARRAGERVLIAESIPDTETATVEQELLVAEQHAVLRDALARLPPSCRQLLVLLSADPPVPYAEISARLGISVGSIGPNRRRCLDRLARDPAIAALIGTEAASTAG